MFPSSFASLNAQRKHDYILKNYVLNKGAGEKWQRHKQDIDVIKENHRFLWEDDDLPQTWETRLAKKYYDKLLKEYCIADLTRYKENKIALRWRTEQEVVIGKGQFQCGGRNCESKDELRSWEVNFGYMEQGARKNALVKLRLCPEHTTHLNYSSKKREVKRLKRTARKERKRIRSEDETNTKTRRSRTSKDDEKAEYINRDGDELGHRMSSSKSKTECNEEKEEYTIANEENVWAKKSEELETKSRETDFERYLEDLLL